jgi:hypothetical protein
LRFALVPLLCAASGCSFAFVHGPPANHRQLPFFDCTTSNILPALDGLLGLVLVGETVDGTDSGLSASTKTAIGVAVAEAVLFGASAVYGFKKTSDCRDAQNLLLMRMPPPQAPSFAAPPPAPPIDPWTGRPLSDH